MAPADRILALAAELDAALPVLDRINRFYDRFQRQQTAPRHSTKLCPGSPACMHGLSRKFRSRSETLPSELEGWQTVP